MIEERHRVAALAALATEAELEQALDTQVWALLVREGHVAQNFTRKGAAGLALTEPGLEFLVRALQRVS